MAWIEKRSHKDGGRSWQNRVEPGIEDPSAQGGTA
jgi:hypothetical protein